MAKTKVKFDWRFVLLLPIPILWALAAQLGYLRNANDLLLDWRFQVRGELDAPVRVVYVDIDAKSIDDLKNFPWPRSYFSRVGEALIGVGGAKAVGVDVVFSENGVSPAYDAKLWVDANREFARFLLKHPPMVFAASYASTEYREVNNKLTRRELPMLRDGLPPLEQIHPPEILELSFRAGVTWSPPRVALIDTIDGGTRWVPLFAPTATNAARRFDHMALALALVYWGVDAESVRITPEALEVPGPDGSVHARIPLTDQQLLEVNWFSHWLSDKNPRIGFSTALVYAQALHSAVEQERVNAREFFAQFQDAVVIIGPVDPLLQDLATTPFDNVAVPKVGIHGNLLKTIVSGKYLQRLPTWTLYFITLALAVAVTILATIGGSRGLWSKLAALALLLGYAGLCFALFTTSHLVLPMVAPLGGALTTAFAGIVWQLIVEEKQKSRIKGMFGAYVSPELVSRMVESDAEPRLGGHDAEITAYFSDIQSFSAFSEKLGSGPLVELMNEYLTACTDIVQGEGGTLDKYIGDAVVAMFGAPIPLPDHAYRACVASQLVHAKLAALRAKWKSEGGKWPEIVHRMQTRVGLNSGTCMIGNMGSRTRFNYTMMGDNVNLAARMESGAKQFGVYTMVTEATKLACEQHGGDRVVFRFLDQIVVQGRSVAVRIYEVVGLKENLTATTRECLELHAQAVERYLAQDFDGAIAQWEKSSLLEPNLPGRDPGVEGNPSLAFIQRCAYMKAHVPGPGWDGVFVMKEK
ncbi:MAG: adenylate/guanylate cyclase domain-containing protein [Candidatus Didemnitutus sp.]|nr:adenylate/guanylate cyclase domain-containing protein [Candidatus Didemnitutus sp.]